MKSLPFLILGGICVWLIVITFLIVSCTSGHAQNNPSIVGVPNLLTNGEYVYKLTGSNVLTYLDGTQQQSTSSKASDVLASILSVTNFIADIGGGSALSGHATYIGEASVLYNMTPNQGVWFGPLLGYKVVKIEGTKGQTVDTLRGGGSLGIPFTNRWTGSIIWNPNAETAIVTPSHGTGVGMDNAIGLGVTFWHNKSVAFDFDGSFVNSTGQGPVDRNYGLGVLALKCGF